MSNIKGYVVFLKRDREDSFKHNQYESFGEPVPEFSHSRNIPLICFIVNNKQLLTHIALGKRGNLAGTDIRRLNLENIFELKSIVTINSIIDSAPSTLKSKVNEKLKNGGLVPPKTFEFLIKEVTKQAPETSPILSKYSEARSVRIERIPSNVKGIFAEQKEAVATALTIAGIERKELQGWDIDEQSPPDSYLDGLDQVRLREDPMVINDLESLPGFEAIKRTSFSSVVFENDQSKLTVLLANRLPLEKQLGVDLIYYNETFSCFLMIQYKAMEQENSDFLYRFPNEQLTEEINRMDSVLSELKKVPANTEADGFRLNENPFFFKICPRIIFRPDNIGLITGMYLPLDYWKVLTKHPSMKGSRGGKRLTYQNVRRYFSNTEFVTLASGGWVGTNIGQSKLLQKAIKSTLRSGRSVVFAVKKEKDSRHRSS